MITMVPILDPSTVEINNSLDGDDESVEKESHVLPDILDSGIIDMDQGDPDYALDRLKALCETSV